MSSGSPLFPGDSDIDQLRKIFRLVLIFTECMREKNHSDWIKILLWFHSTLAFLEHQAKTIGRALQIYAFIATSFQRHFISRKHVFTRNVWCVAPDSICSERCFSIIQLNEFQRKKSSIIHISMASITRSVSHHWPIKSLHQQMVPFPIWFEFGILFLDLYYYLCLILLKSFAIRLETRRIVEKIYWKY